MEYKLQIELIHKDKSIFSNKNTDLIQTKPFKIGFLVKNIGTIPIVGTKITNIKWGSSDGKNIFATSEKSFNLDTLNPDEETKIWVDETGTYMYGLCNVSFDITPDKEGEKIKTFQKDKFTGAISFCQINCWIDFFFIRSKNEYEQSQANKFMLFFAIISILTAVITLYMTKQQRDYTELQSRSERINQNRLINEAKESCKKSPDSKDSGLFNVSNGQSASCAEVLHQYK